MVSSFVDLSTTNSGVATLPQSWSQAAIFNSYISLSVKEISAKGPSIVSWTAFANNIVISGTRAQWPPVYGDFASIADAISLMNDSNKASRSLIKFLFVIATAAWLASASTISWTSDANEIIFFEFWDCAFNNWRTPIISSSWFFNGTVRNDCEW